MILHHIGCIVEEIKSAILHYKMLGDISQDVSEIYDITDQEVKVCFLEMSNGFKLELVEPYPSNKTLIKMRKKGVGFYHMGFLVADLNAKISELEESGYRYLNTFNSEAFNGRLCSFLLSPDLQLIELVEK